MASVASNIKVLKFAEVEREGVKVEKIISPLSSKSSHSCCKLVKIINFFQTQVMSSLYLFTNPNPACYKELS